MTFNLALMGHPYTAAVSKPSAVNLNYICVSLANSLDPVSGGTYVNTTGTQTIIQGDKGWKFDYSAGPGLEIAGTVGMSILNGSFLTVDLGGTLRLASGSMTEFVSGAEVSGSAVVILALEATSHITGEVEWDATITGGSSFSYASGASVNFTAGTTLLLNGAASAGSGSTTTFLSGAALTANAGSTVALNGTTTISALGNTTLVSGATFTAASGSAISAASGSTTTFSGLVTHSGTGGRIARRFSPVLADADQTIDTTFDFYRFTTPGAARTIQLRVSTSPVPVAGEVIEVSRPAAGAFDIVIYNEGALINAIVTLNASTFAAARFAFTGTAWALIGFSTNAVPGAAA